MLDRDRLGDHPSHRGTDDVGAVQPERVEQADGVRRHVGKRVGRRGRIAGSAAGRSGLGASGKCDDRPASRLSNRTTCRPRATSPAQKPSGRPSSWAADPHHQQYGRRLEVAEALVRHLDARRPAIQGLFFAHVIPS
jgi:hypothetical protein